MNIILDNKYNKIGKLLNSIKTTIITILTYIDHPFLHGQRVASEQLKDLQTQIYQWLINLLWRLWMPILPYWPRNIAKWINILIRIWWILWKQKNCIDKIFSKLLMLTCNLTSKRINSLIPYTFSSRVSGMVNSKSSLSSLPSRLRSLSEL